MIKNSIKRLKWILIDKLIGFALGGKNTTESGAIANYWTRGWVEFRESKHGANDWFEIWLCGKRVVADTMPFFYEERFNN